MKIIGHRGAAGSELENTLASLQKAIALGVYAIEFDVRRTSDNHLVVCHDADMQRTAGDPRKISELTLKQLQKVPQLTGSSVPSLREALEVIGKKRAVIEIKDSDCAAELVSTLKDFPEANVTIASFKLNELSAVKEHAPELKVYALEKTKPFDIIQLAKENHYDGVGLNYWLLNPLTYYWCRRADLDMYVYTVDSPFLAKFINFFYPEIGLCTNYPERFLKKRRSS